MRQKTMRRKNPQNFYIATEDDSIEDVSMQKTHNNVSSSAADQEKHKKELDIKENLIKK